MASLAEGAGDQAALRRGLSSALVGAPIVGGDDASTLTPDGEPLRRQSTSQLNRNRFQENQRYLAAQLLMYSLPVMGCIAVMLVALLIASVVIYVQGWMIMSNFSDKPCDQPLKWWLLVMLLVPILQCQLNSSTQPDQRPKRMQALVMPLAITCGVWMVYHCKTCEKTAPELYRYAKMYLIYQSVVWVTMLFFSCGLVSLVFWMARNGLLDSGPGPASAARPGLINDIETVRFRPELFSDVKDDEPQPPECSICQEEFAENAELKRTPCGHYFCPDCLGNWLENYAKTCPLCREDLEQAMDASGENDQP